MTDESHRATRANNHITYSVSVVDDNKPSGSFEMILRDASSLKAACCVRAKYELFAHHETHRFKRGNDAKRAGRRASMLLLTTSLSRACLIRNVALTHARVAQTHHWSDFISDTPSGTSFNLLKLHHSLRSTVSIKKQHTINTKR